jgi:hypothetical protein
MELADLKEASFDGAVFLIDSSTTTGGRKIVKKQIIDSDSIVQEDLGLLTETYTINGYIATLRGAEGAVRISYAKMRRDLLKALNKGGPRVLVHPFFGRIDNVIAVSWNLNQSISRLGIGTIAITFEPYTGEGVKLTGKSRVSDVTLKKEVLAESVWADLSRVDAAPDKAGVFEGLKNVATAAVDAVDAASQALEREAAKIDAFNKNIQNFSDNITQLIAAPQAYADALVGTFQSLGGLYQSVTATFDAFVSLFTFESFSFRFDGTDTDARATRRANDTIVNTAMRVLAVAYAYEAAVLDTYTTVDEIDARNEILEDEYQSILEIEDANNDVIADLQELRIAAQGVFDDQKLVARQIIEVETAPTSTSLLAYKYFGDSTLGFVIGDLNELEHNSYVEGTVKILSA